MNCWERKEVCTVRHNNIFSLPILQKKPIHGIYVFLFKILSMNNFIWPKTHRFIEFWVGNNSETKMSKSNSISEITFYLSRPPFCRFSFFVKTTKQNFCFTFFVLYAKKYKKTRTRKRINFHFKIQFYVQTLSIKPSTKIDFHFTVFWFTFFLGGGGENLPFFSKQSVGPPLPFNKKPADPHL